MARSILFMVLAMTAMACDDDNNCDARRDRLIEQSLDRRRLSGPEREAHRQALLAAAGTTVCPTGGQP
jgi:hypothetical protein